MSATTTDAPVGATYASAAEAIEAGRDATYRDQRMRYVVRMADGYRVLTLSELVESEGDGEVVTTLRLLVDSDDYRQPLADLRTRMRHVVERVEAEYAAKYGVRPAPTSPRSA